MSGHLESLLRDAVADLAAEGRPVNLAGPAMRRARMIRTRRIVAAGISAVVLIAGLAVVTAAGVPVRSDRPAGTGGRAVTASVSPSPGHRPVLLPGNWAVRAAPTAEGLTVFDDRTGGYTEVPVPGGVASPDGRYVVALGSTIRIRDLGTNVDVDTRLPTTAGSTPAWSADNTRFAYVTPTNAVGIVTLATGTGIGTAPLNCLGGCDLRWSNDDREIRVYANGSIQAVDTADGTFSYPNAARRDDTDPCAGHRGHPVPVTALTPQERADFDGSQDVWGCLFGGGFELRSAAGKRSTVTDLTGTGFPGRFDQPERVTLFQRTG